MPIAPLLQRFIDDELALSGAIVSRVLAGTMQLLGSSREAELDVLAKLKRSSGSYEEAFVESLRKHAFNNANDPRDVLQPEPKSGLGTLQLMDESLVEADIEISRAMQLIDSTAEWELRELQTFTSTLIGKTHVTAESNPLRPLTYATALWDAARVVSSSQAQRALLLRTSAGVAAGLLKRAWAAASTRLEAQGVEAGAYRTVVLPAGSAFGRLAGAEASRSGALAGLLSSMPVGAPPGGPLAHGTSPFLGAAPAGPFGLRNPGLDAALQTVEHMLHPAPSAEELDISLGDDEPAEPAAAASSPDGAAQPASGLGKYRVALLAAANDPLERQTIELVSRLFDAMLADPQVPAPARPLLARPQVAALRVALADPAMRSTHEHPVWNLFDRIAGVSVGYPRSGDPRLAAFLSLCAGIVDEIAAAPAPDAETFQRGLNRVDAVLAEPLRTQRRAAQPAIDALQLAERRELLEGSLSHRLAEQIAALRTTPAMRRFVTGTWAKVIATNMIRHGEQSEPAMGDLKTADDLLWSLQIPDHPQSRQRLIALLPGLLPRLRAGMELVELAVPERQAVLNDLMAIHTEALRPGTQSASGALSPEQIVQKMRDEVSADASGRRPFSDSVIDLSSMETVPADALPSRGDADEPASKRVDSLRAADRQRLFLHGQWNRVQLLWQSDRGHFFLFAGETPGRHHSITRRALERLNSAGLLLPHEAKPLVQRAADQMVRGLSTRSA